jgi:hypothetical protein
MAGGADTNEEFVTWGYVQDWQKISTECRNDELVGELPRELQEIVWGDESAYGAAEVMDGTGQKAAIRYADVLGWVKEILQKKKGRTQPGEGEGCGEVEKEQKGAVTWGYVKQWRTTFQEVWKDVRLLGVLPWSLQAVMSMDDAEWGDETIMDGSVLGEPVGVDTIKTWVREITQKTRCRERAAAACVVLGGEGDGGEEPAGDSRKGEQSSRLAIVREFLPST